MKIIHTANLIYVGDDRVDVSPQGKDPAGAPFAPSWALRSDALDRRLAGVEERTWWAEFAARYLAEARVQIAQNRAAWEALSRRPEVTLVCSCVRAERCHRSLLARLLEDRGAQYLGERPSPYAASLIEEPPTEISRVRAAVLAVPLAIKAAGGGRSEEGLAPSPASVRERLAENIFTVEHSPSHAHVILRKCRACRAIAFLSRP